MDLTDLERQFYFEALKFKDNISKLLINIFKISSSEPLTLLSINFYPILNIFI